MFLLLETVKKEKRKIFPHINIPISYNKTEEYAPNIIKQPSLFYSAETASSNWQNSTLPAKFSPKKSPTSNLELEKKSHEASFLSKKKLFVDEHDTLKRKKRTLFNAYEEIKHLLNLPSSYSKLDILNDGINFSKNIYY